MSDGIRTEEGNVSTLPKLLIISSYKRPCGIAHYLEHLEIPLREQNMYEIEIVALPVELLRGKSLFARKSARIFMQDLHKKIANADIVNIQFELGLFGTNPIIIMSRLRLIIKAAKKVILTYHTVPPMTHARVKFNFKGFSQFVKEWSWMLVFNYVFALVRTNPKKFFHIVHTQREMNHFVMLGIQRDTIEHRPLSFLHEEKRDYFLKNKQEIQKQIKIEYGISGKMMGCFGFLSPYKGIEVAIRALNYLPEDYHLLIVGGLHPEGIEFGTVEQTYIKSLLSELAPGHQKNTENPHRYLQKRISFCGALDHEKFNHVMAACDAVILPYAEVGQTSSGPAALAMDMQAAVYCSRNGCFTELDKYQSGMLSFFEVGNYIELSEKILRREGNIASKVAARARFLELFNISTRADAYIRACNHLFMDMK